MSAADLTIAHVSGGVCVNPQIERKKSLSH
jgi:hypothetical protein